MKRLLFILLVCTKTITAQETSPFLTGKIQPAVFSISRVMMHDVINPPAASRYYAYVLLGAYEIVAQNNPSVTGLSSFIKSYTGTPVSKSNREYDYRVASVYCILETGRLLLPSGFMLEEDQQKFLTSLKKEKLSKKNYCQLSSRS